MIFTILFTFINSCRSCWLQHQDISVVSVRAIMACGGWRMRSTHSWHRHWMEGNKLHARAVSSQGQPPRIQPFKIINPLLLISFYPEDACSKLL